MPDLHIKMTNTDLYLLSDLLTWKIVFQQVDFDRPDYTRFPKLADARGQEAVVGPGRCV